MEYLEDGTVDFTLGQDAWKSPDLIQVNQFAKGVNLSTRNGKLHSRDGYFFQDISFDDVDIKVSTRHGRLISDIWLNGKAQAVIPFIDGSDEYVITVVCGLIYRTAIKTFKTSLLSEKIRTSQYSPRINWSYASDKVILYDYPDYPIIIDKDDVRRADPLKNEIPISRLGAYNQNRLFIATIAEFTAGDPVGSLASPHAPITFNELLTPNSPFFNQVFSEPIDESMHPITAMGFIQELDTNTGIGMMYVGTSDKFLYYRTDQPRSNWGQGNQFGGVLLSNAGIAGPRAVANVNSDIIFITPDYKVHALSTARNESRRWGNVPISREVQNFLKLSEQRLSQFACVGYFDNRIYITANPYRVGSLDRSGHPISDYAHGGFVILELENMSSFMSEGNPTWVGLWTGLDPVDMFEVNKKGFILGKQGDGKFKSNAFYRIKEDTSYDGLPLNVKRPITSIVETKRYDCQNKFIQKREHTLSVGLNNIGGDFSLKIDRKPTHSNKWLKYAEWKHSAVVETKELPEDAFINGYDTHRFKHVVFGDALEKGSSPITEEEYDTFMQVEYRLIMRGLSWKLDHLRIRAQPLQYLERPDVTQEELSEEPLALEFLPDWLIPSEV